MAETTIEWTATRMPDGNMRSGFTFNPWVGCTRVSSACDHCYAESWAKRTGHPELWQGQRRRTTAANWRLPLKWNDQAAAEGVRRKVFCASLADVFDNQVPDDWRHDLWDLIIATQHLDWLLLTKRPQNAGKMLPDYWWPGRLNTWIGTTVENQDEADRRIPHLLALPAIVHFLSCEPLLGQIDLRNVYHNKILTDALDGISEHGVVDMGDRMVAINPQYIQHAKLQWVIAGGESGPKRRPMKLAWMRSLRDQCAEASIPFFGKQLDKVAPLPADLMVREFPVAA